MTFTDLFKKDVSFFPAKLATHLKKADEANVVLGVSVQAEGEA